MRVERRLVHLSEAGADVFVTFCLAGSMPVGHVFIGIESGAAFVCMDQTIEKNKRSPRYLVMPEIAQIVLEAIHAADSVDYCLHAWAIMPNHVHLLFETHKPLPEIMRRLKGSTARKANLLLNRVGQNFWQQESYDRLVRNRQEFERIRNYILQNPVKAGLVASPELYPYSGVV